MNINLANCIPKESDTICFIDFKINGDIYNATEFDKFAVFSYGAKKSQKYQHDYIEEYALPLLQKYDFIVGHGIIESAMPVINRLWPQFLFPNLFDTLVASRAIYSDAVDFDLSTLNKHLNLMPVDNPIIDMSIIVALYKKLISQNEYFNVINLEHNFQKIITLQGVNGVCINRSEMEKLRDDLSIKIYEYEEKIKNKCKFKNENSLDPSSKNDIILYLLDHGWEPQSDEIQDNGVPYLNHSILEKIKIPGTDELITFSKYSTLYNQLYKGECPCSKSIMSDGRVHSHMLSTGTRTGRCSHFKPNLGNIPKRDKLFGQRVRSLFYAPDGYIMLGGDFKSIDLRILAHYMAFYDKGVYANAVSSCSDIHSYHMRLLQLESREIAKQIAYALIYGASNKRLGEIALPNGTIQLQKAKGKEIRAKLNKELPAYEELKTKIQSIAIERPLKGIDGRPLYIERDKIYSALNTLIQCGSAVVVKYATIILHKLLAETGLIDGEHYQQVLHVHDEIQLYVQPQYLELLTAKFHEAVKLTTEHFKLKCPLEIEVKSGKTWADTH